jgi:ribosomal protein L11 methyltransferase
MNWFVLSADAPPPGEEYRMIDVLRRLGARAVEREGERVVAWLPPPADAAVLLAEAALALRVSTGAADAGLSWEWRTEEAAHRQWLAQATARRITDRITVVPSAADDGGRLATSHEPDGDRRRAASPGARDIRITLAPGAGFGDASHATTRGCLILLEEAVQPGATVLDIGTGSGILAVAAALLGADEVLALELDPLACSGAQRNAAVNNVADRVEVRCMRADVAALHALAACDVVLANLDGDTLLRLLPGLQRCLVPGGTLILAGVTVGERGAVLEVAAVAGLVLARQEYVDGWWCAALRRGEGG